MEVSNLSQDEENAHSPDTPLLASPALCRICGDDASRGELRSVCRCNAVVHPPCQLRWCEQRSASMLPTLLATTSLCEVCHSPLQIRNSVWGALASLEACAALLLVALALAAHLLYRHALHQRHATRVMATLLAGCNALAVAALLCVLCRALYVALRYTNSNNTNGGGGGVAEKFLLALGATLSIASAAVVYCIAI